MVVLACDRQLWSATISAASKRSGSSFARFLILLVLVVAGVIVVSIFVAIVWMIASSILNQRERNSAFKALREGETAELRTVLATERPWTSQSGFVLSPTLTQFPPIDLGVSGAYEYRFVVTHPSVPPDMHLDAPGGRDQRQPNLWAADIAAGLYDDTNQSLIWAAVGHLRRPSEAAWGLSPEVWRWTGSGYYHAGSIPNEVGPFPSQIQLVPGHQYRLLIVVEPDPAGTESIVVSPSFEMHWAK